MHLSDLQVKTVVDLIDGRNLGRIVDAEMDNTGKITNFVIEKKKFWKFFSNTPETIINYNQIKKIGEDIILVEINSHNH